MNRTMTAISLLCALLLLTGCSQLPEQEEIWEMEQESVTVFSDGETVDLWRARKGELRGSVAWYELSDGTVLLLEDDPVEPENPGLMTEDAWAEVKQTLGAGVRYDIQSLLEQAYTAYTTCQQEGWEYQPVEVGQATALIASNQDLVWLSTTVRLAVDPENPQEEQLGNAFDRATGQALDVWSLFTVEEGAVRAKLVSQAEEALRAELAQALDPGRILFYPDRLEVSFPAGAVSGQEEALTLRWEYSEIAEILQPWAIPDAAA